ncbi:MAG: 30S ribosomal protein S2, partial [Candidatus Omnitrophica bacterium]|nr:30S ribosomal protein S2 [Candidatus Omnitrophota bacterium]
ETAVREARRLLIPVIGFIDTNSDPGLVDFPIPGNDDATKSIRIVAGLIAESIIEGRNKFLSYLTHEGAIVKDQKKSDDAALVLPEEEVRIKEIEEIVEKTEPPGEDSKTARKGRTGGPVRKKTGL